MIRKIISIFAAAIFAVSAASCATQTATTPTAQSEADAVEAPVVEAPAVEGEYTATILKTGKSDAIILEGGDGVVLIDCGEEDDGAKVVEYLKSKGKTKIDYLFITHFDQDHIGGAPEVMANMEIGEIITPNYDGNNSEYEAFAAALSGSGKERLKLTQNLTFALGDVLYQIYPPLKTSYASEDNDFSLVIKATHGHDTFLFTGDAMETRLTELFDQIGDLSADFLKVPYHGNYVSNSKKFIEAVSPKYAVITCNKKEGADGRVVSTLKSVGAETYLNRDGTVTAISTGNGITVTQATQ